MTTSRLSPPLAVETVGSAAAELRRRGLRVSAARRLVLESLFAAEGPVSAEQIASGLEGRLPRSDLASVYRNLEAFEELGLVCHVHLGHGPGLYGLAGRGPREYLLCDGCGRVDGVEPSALDPLREVVRARFGYELRLGHFPLVGLCPDCARTGASVPANNR